MQALETVDQSKVAKIHPEQIAIIFDGWKGGDSHYFAVFANFLSGKDCTYNTVLLGMSPMESEA